MEAEAEAEALKIFEMEAEAEAEAKKILKMEAEAEAVQKFGASTSLVTRYVPFVIQATFSVLNHLLLLIIS